MLKRLAGTLVAALTGCGGVRGYRDAEHRMIPHRGLGDDLPTSSVPYGECGLDFEAAYVFSVHIYSPDARSIARTHTAMLFFRFWADGRAAIATARLQEGEALGPEHVDKMGGTIVGRYSARPEGIYIEVYDLVGPPHPRWDFVTYRSHIGPGGDLQITGMKVRGDKEWKQKVLVGKKYTFGGIRYQPTW